MTATARIAVEALAIASTVPIRQMAGYFPAQVERVKISPNTTVPRCWRSR